MTYIFRFLRLKVPEVGGNIVSSSDARNDTFECFCKGHYPDNVQDVRNILGDQSHKENTIFRESGDDDYVKTICVGK